MILIAMGETEFNNSEVTTLEKLLKSESLNYEIIKQADKHQYIELERQIENCSIYIQVVGPTLDGSTWLNHCLFYMESLNQHRQSHRVTIHGLAIDNFKVPVCSQALMDKYKVFQAGADLFNHINT